MAKWKVSKIAKKNQRCEICKRRLKFPRDYICLPCLIELTEGVVQPRELVPEIEGSLDEEVDDEAD